MTPRRSKFENENLVRSEFFQIFLPDDPKEIQVRIWEFFPRQTGLLALQNLDFATNTSELFDCSNIDLACNQIKHTSNSKFKYFQRSFFIYGSKTLEYWHYDFENFPLIFLYIFFQMTSRKSKFEFENFFPRRWIIGTTKFRKKIFSDLGSTRWNIGTTKFESHFSDNFLIEQWYMRFESHKIIIHKKIVVPAFS